MSPFGVRQLAASMRAVRQNTILIAGDIPELKYVSATDRVSGVARKAKGSKVIAHNPGAALATELSITPNP